MSSAASDYSLALQLQNEYDRELASLSDDVPDVMTDVEIPPAVKRRRISTKSIIGYKGAAAAFAATEDDLNSTQNLVHPEWETIDPTPDIFALFGAFNVKFFNGKLHCVQLEWSKKMYTCAGICYQRRNRMGMAITIRLSEPLLKLRQRKDLVETLLHEMIHAFLFVLNVREGNGGHGPSFKKIMEKINRTAGTNISVYHTFHDEVNLYKTHVWRCNGICQHRQPFFGYIRRTCNRAPGPNDQWWATHQQTCGGYFKKTSEPEPKKKGGAGSKAPPTVQSTGQQNINHPKWGLGDTKIRAPPVKESRNTIGGNLTNVHGFNDSKPKSNRDLPATIPQSGGHSLGGGSSKNVQSVRDVWSTKFVAGTTSTTATATATTSDLKMLDDDIGIFETINPTIDLCDDQSDEEATALPVPRSKLTPNERQSQIKAEIMDIGDNDSEIELIDDDYDDELANTTTVLGDTSVIDDIFGSDTLLSEFNDVNGAVAGRSCDVPFEIISCPICPECMRRDQLLEHLNGCGGIRVSIEAKPPSHSSGVTTSNKNAKKKKKSTPFERQSQPAPSTRNILLESGYSEETVNQILKEQREEENYNNRIMMEMRNENLHQTSPSPPIQEPKLVPCPICEEYVDERNINEHIDECLLKAEE